MTLVLTTAGFAAPRATAVPAAPPSLLQGVRIRTDQLLGALLGAHLPVVLGLGIQQEHGTVPVAIGTAVSVGALLAVWLRPGALATRLLVGAGFMVYSALLIHLTGGMVEMHSHIFASLAFLLMYRDWRVPVAAAGLIIVHHVIFNYGSHIVAVHGGFVLFEVTVLVYMARLLAEETEQSQVLLTLAERLGAGDLTVRASGGGGPVGMAVAGVSRGADVMDSMVCAIKGRAVDVASTAEQLDLACRHMAASSLALSNALDQVTLGAERQSRDTAAMSGVLGSVVGAIDDVAQLAAEMSSSSRRAAEVAGNGTAVVTQTVEGIGRMRSAILDSSERIRELERSSRAIGDVVHVITDIAEQTNLLALNAAIEAARAGAHGRGFGVVADEVRSLAEAAGRSVREIATLTKHIEHGVDEVVRAMVVGTREAEEGERLAGATGRAFAELLAVVRQHERDVAAISEAARGIATGSRGMLGDASEGDTVGAEGAHSMRGLALLASANARSVTDASMAVGDITGSMGEVERSAAELGAIADVLRTQVSAFRVSDEVG